MRGEWHEVGEAFETNKPHAEALKNSGLVEFGKKETAPRIGAAPEKGKTSKSGGK